MKPKEWAHTPNRFKDKVAIITGGGAGIGRAIVAELCKEGAKVLFTDIRAECDDSLEADKKMGFEIHFLQGDMAEESFCKEAVEKTVELFGRVDYLVNNAFSFIGQGVEATTEDWKRIFDAGPIAYARMVQLTAPHMTAVGGGAVVNVSSISAHIAQIDRWTYNSAKGAVDQLTKCQALDLAPQGIRVNSVDPGWIWTNETQKAADLDGGGQEKWDPIWGKFHMLRRVGHPVEVARPALFLLSGDASFITGTKLMIDGGYLSLGPEGLGEETVNAGSN
ncbi:MAG: SDR family oxidoreductase [Cyclobacteriaceae bacterium]